MIVSKHSATAEMMNARTRNVKVAKETVDILKKGSYVSPSGQTVDISAELKKAVDETVYHVGPLPQIWGVSAIYNPTVEVSNETTAQAAVRLIAAGKEVVALNFASGRSVGGGFLSGAIAQEEDLCRCSGLYACLKKKPLFYNANILTDSHYYTNGLIYSPRVPFIRDHNLQLLEQPFYSSIISSPAPNLSFVEQVDEELLDLVLEARMDKILLAAHHNGHKNIILGAWGCGAYRNNPTTIATAFNKALSRLPYFEHITFAVYDPRPEQPVYEVFKQQFIK